MAVIDDYLAIRPEAEPVLRRLAAAGRHPRMASPAEPLTQLYRMPAQGGIVSSTSGSVERSSGRTILAVILGIIALVFIVVAVIYLAEPAKSLPSFVPGHIAGSSGHHPLKATGSLVVGIIFAVGAWFALAYKPKPQAATQNDRESSPAGHS